MEKVARGPQARGQAAALNTTAFVAVQHDADSKALARDCKPFLLRRNIFM
ncbi:MAG: hypothetical protein Q4D74_00615 [Comamonadaceae bacterium]|nr:hypothetical protein [Comamonadaceae bacterium]